MRPSVKLTVMPKLLPRKGKGVSWVRGKGSKLGEPYPKVTLSQDMLPIEPFKPGIVLVKVMTFIG